jgi:MOSC domain-containing protein YiiM
MAEIGLRKRMIRVLSVQVGLPKTLTSQDTIGLSQATWVSAFHKLPVDGPVWVGKTNVAGDGQASVKTHGGPDKAVCVYPWEHYCYWQQLLDLSELGFGSFAENLTVEGQLEDHVCIGDLFAVGDAVLQVTQPRPPCWRLARWWRRSEFVSLMEESGRTGWYCGVAREGNVTAGDTIELVERRYSRWSVSAANRLLYGTDADADEVLDLASCRLLSASTRESLLKRAAQLSAMVR